MSRNASKSNPLELRITKLERDKDNKWRCNVTVEGTTFPIHCKYGSWMYEDENGMKDVHLWIAEAVVEKVRAIEKKERIAREKAEENDRA